MLSTNINSIFSKEILRGSSTTLILKIITIISGYFFIYIINKFYGTAFVGIFSIIQSLIFILSVLSTLGFDTLTVKLFSSNIKDVSYLRRIYKVILSRTIPISIFLTIPLELGFAQSPHC